jgi:hypothetical protein
MSSTLTTYSNNINTTYPYPGVDNDTQGFRDNFANIKNALNTAAGEIGNLLQGSVKTTDNLNDFNRNVIYKPTLQAEGYTVNNAGAVSGNVIVDLLLGSYHQLEINGNANLSFLNWAGIEKYSKVRLEIKNASTNSNSTVVFNGSTGTTGYTLSSSTYSRPVFFDVWSTNNGSIIHTHKVVDTSVPSTTASVDYATFVTNPDQPYITSVGQLTQLGIGSATIKISNNQMIVTGVSGLTVDTGETVSSQIVGFYDSGGGGLHDGVFLTSVNNIEIGSTFKFYGTDTNTYVVSGVNTSTKLITTTAGFDALSLESHGVTTATLGGTTLNFAVSLSNGSVFYSPSIPETLKGKSGDKKGKLIASSDGIYVCYNNYTDGTENIWTIAAPAQSTLLVKTESTSTVTYDISRANKALHSNITGQITPNFVGLPTDAARVEVFIDAHYGATPWAFNTSSIYIGGVLTQVSAWKKVQSTATGIASVSVTVSATNIVTTTTSIIVPTSVPVWSVAIPAYSKSIYHYTLINPGTGVWTVLGDREDYV